MLKGIYSDMVTYDVLINGLCKTGNLEDSYVLWMKMVIDGLQPYSVTYTCLIHAHCERGCLREAMNIFDCMVSGDRKSVV